MTLPDSISLIVPGRVDFIGDEAMWVNSTYFLQVALNDGATPTPADHDLTPYVEFAAWVKKSPDDADADAVAIGTFVVESAVDGEGYVRYEAEDLTQEHVGQLWHSLHGRTASGIWLPLMWGLAELKPMAGNPLA